MSDVAPIDRINQLQADIKAGKDIPAEVMNEAIQQLRSERVGASAAATERKGRKSTPPVDLGALLSKYEKDTEGDGDGGS